MPVTAPRPAKHPIFARTWPWMSRALEHGGMGEHRQALLAGLSGQVIEIGAGDGTNFAHYPATVTGVLAIEPEPSLRRRAEAAAALAPVPVTVLDALAGHLPVAEASMDAAVFCLVLCSLPDVQAGLAEAFRVLKPGGRLCFLEHGRADSPGVIRLQRALDATFWPHLMGGCHTGRDTIADIQRAGFTITELERYLFPAARTPFSFHVLGRASRP